MVPCCLFLPYYTLKSYGNPYGYWEESNLIARVDEQTADTLTKTNAYFFSWRYMDRSQTWYPTPVFDCHTNQVEVAIAGCPAISIHQNIVVTAMQVHSQSFLIVSLTKHHIISWCRTEGYTTCTGILSSETCHEISQHTKTVIMFPLPTAIQEVIHMQ